MTTDDRHLGLGDFATTRVLSSRWADNDVYGHLNNAVHYQLFDSAINAWIAEQTPELVARREVIGVVARSGCSYFSELAYPDDIVVGLRVERLGTSSVTYGLGLFARPREAATGPIAAKGTWVQVYLDSESRKPTPIPEPLRRALESARVPSNPAG